MVRVGIPAPYCLLTASQEPAYLVVAQQLLALLLAAPQGVLTLLRLLCQGPDLQALLGVPLRQHLQLLLQCLHVQPSQHRMGQRWTLRAILPLLGLESRLSIVGSRYLVVLNSAH